MAKHALGTLARDDLAICGITAVRPIQTAFTLAATFAVGAAMPLAMVLLSLFFLFSFFGANVMKAALRVTFSRVPGMVLTAVIGAVFGTLIGECG